MARVLVTRAQPEADATAARLAALGHEAIVAPLTKIEPLPDGLAALTIRLAEADSDIALFVATSSRAIQVTESEEFFPALARFPWAVVGTRSANKLSELGAELAVPPAPDVQHLIAGLREKQQARAEAPDQVYLCGADRRAALEAAFPDLIALEIYRAQECDGFDAETLSNLQEKLAEFALVYSARSAALTAAAFTKAGLADLAQRIIWMCLSQEVADALQGAFGSQVPARIAPQPDEGALFALLP
ncbi:MAG: uroporphyrinogen-III synthase [Cohaesibacteraceae bacterium]